MIKLLFGFLLAVLTTSVFAADQTVDACPPEGQLNFVCGVNGPEDLLLLPGGKWIVASGLTVNSGLHLINAETKTAERWLPAPMGAPSQPYQACPSPPVLEEFQAHGISVRDHGQGRATLYVVNHGDRVPWHFPGAASRETIEVFDVDMNGAKPVLSWRGCVPLPLGLSGNGVTSTADGTILVTVPMHPGMGVPDYMAGRITGAVYQWHPGDAGFARVWGTELTADNGIDISPDGKTLYVVGKGGLTVFSNTNPAKVLHYVPITVGAADNVHWSDGKLIVGGVTHPADKACNDPLKAAAGTLGDKCIPAYFVALIDPATLKVTTLAAGPGSRSFTGVASGVVVGKTLWLSSFNAQKVAYRALP